MSTPQESSPLVQRPLTRQPSLPPMPTSPITNRFTSQPPKRVRFDIASNLTSSSDTPGESEEGFSQMDSDPTGEEETARRLFHTKELQTNGRKSKDRRDAPAISIRRGEGSLRRGTVYSHFGVRRTRIYICNGKRRLCYTDTSPSTT